VGFNGGSSGRTSRVAKQPDDPRTQAFRHLKRSGSSARRQFQRCLGAPANNSALLVQSDRQNATYGSGVDTSVAFRVQDADNFWFAYTHDSGTKLSIGYYHAGIRTDVASYNMPTAWTALRVSTSPPVGGLNIAAD